MKNFNIKALSARFLSSLLSTVFIVQSVSFGSYANAFINQDTNISGGGEMEWSEAESYIKERLARIETDDKYFFGYKTAKYLQNLIETKVTRTYSQYTAEDENIYLVFVCVTYKQPYSVYLKYANEFKEDYANHGLSFAITSEADYEKSKSIMTSMMRSNSNPDGMVLIADSGFSVNKNGLPFYNVGIKGENESGLCAGFSQLSILSYLYPAMLLEYNYDSTMLEGFLKEFDGSTSLNISRISEIMNGQAGAYEPDTFVLQNYVYETGKEISGDYVIDMSQIKDTEDYDLMKSLYYYWYYKNYEIGMEQLDKLESSFDLLEPCPSDELDLVIEELKADRPVEVGVFNDFMQGHSLVGYRLWQDVKDKNVYYLDVYDSNYPKNEGDCEPQIVLYKGQYDGDKEALYFYYAPEKTEGEKVDTDYRFTSRIVFSDYQGNYLHKNNTIEHWNEDI